MATVILMGLTKTQANALGIAAENSELEAIINPILIKYEQTPILIGDVHFGKGEEPDNEIECESSIEDEDEDDEPGYEPEDCECAEEMRANGLEYTQDFHPSEDKTYWICDHCGRNQ